MERMPSASEMERYKQEMLRMYRRANPIVQQAPAQPSREPEPSTPRMVNPPPTPAAPASVQPVAEPIRPVEPPTPPQAPSMPPAAPMPAPECPEVECSEVQCPEAQRPEAQRQPEEPIGVMTSSSATESIPDMRTAPQVSRPPQPVETEEEMSEFLSQAEMDSSTMPRYPEDFPEESSFPQDTRSRRASDIPTEQGTGEPAALEEDDSLGTARVAYPGEVVRDTSSGPRVSDLNFTDIPYVDLPLPEEYLDRFPEIGYIRVKVASSNQALPVKDASIIISKNWNSQNHILHREISDQSGLTPNLPLPAPESKSSMTPGGNGAPRFASYDMLITRDGYVPVIYRSIPVFSGVVTVQPVQMVPQTADPDGQRVIEYEAPAPDNL